MKTKTQFKAGLTAMCFLMSTLFAPILAAQSKVDFTPPTVQHEPDSGKAPAGKPYLFTAEVVDENGVGKVLVFYRTAGTNVFSNIEMKEGKTPGTYMVELAASEIQPPGIEYYIQAEDTSGNTILRGFTFEPLVLGVDDSLPPTTTAAADSEKSSGSLSGLGSNKIVWIGLGALALGALAAGGSGGGGGGGSDDENTVTIGAPLPQ